LTRNNVQIVLRSVLRFATDKGHIRAGPAGLPHLKRIEQPLLEIPTDDEVLCLLRKASNLQRRALALMAYADLRPNEVPALRGSVRAEIGCRRRETEALAAEGNGGVGGLYKSENIGEQGDAPTGPSKGGA
jgi:hypothetical protein